MPVKKVPVKKVQPEYYEESDGPITDDDEEDDYEDSDDEPRGSRKRKAATRSRAPRKMLSFHLLCRTETWNSEAQKIVTVLKTSLGLLGIFPNVFIIVAVN